MSSIDMKKSGIEWVGKIPETWEVKRVANFFKSPKVITSPGRKDVLSLTLNGVIEKDIESNKGLSPESYDTYQIFKTEDLVFKLIDLANYQTSRVGKVWKNGIMSSAYIRLSKNKNTNVNYFYYQFFDLYKRAVFNMLGGNGVRSAINRSDLLKLNIIVPPLHQQTAIANYLDYHTTKIDKEISLLEQKVEKLDEYKQALIYETVTKGLDKNVPMKDSGIEWIGMIPEHWEIKRVKDVSKIFKGKANEMFSEPINNMLPCIDTNFLRKRESSISYSKEGVKINPGKVLILWDGANAGELFLNEDYGYLGSTFGAFNTKIYNKFWFYYLKGIEKNSRNNIIGMGIPHVNGNILKQTLAIIPPKIEQEKIANCLDEQCSKIDKKKELINKKIELIKEYKQSLIYEAVTGKLEVL